MKRLLEKDHNGNPYLREFDNVEVKPETGWEVGGWIGGLGATGATDEIQRGIVIMARGKLVQDAFWLNANPGQQYALAYLVGELHAEFVDEEEDTVATARNGLVWDTEANEALLAWGKRHVETIAREWGDPRQLRWS